MSFLKNIFGGKSKKNSNDNNPIQFIEEKLDTKFPNRFKEFLADKIPKNKDVKIELLDGNYKFLDSLFTEDKLDEYESVINVSNSLNESYYIEDIGLVKIPFAKSTEGDGLKYLYFVSEKGNIANETIYLRDLDSPKTGRIPLCSELPFVIRKSGEVNGQYIISNLYLNFTEAIKWIQIPEFINIWEDSYGLNIRNEEAEDKYSINLFLINYKMDDVNENFSKIEVQTTINHQGKRIDSAMAFEIDNSGLQYQFTNNINYRIFYHKLLCIVTTLSFTKNDLKNNYGIDIETYLNTLNLRDLTIPEFIQIEERSE